MYISVDQHFNVWVYIASNILDDHIRSFHWFSQQCHKGVKAVNGGEPQNTVKWYQFEAVFSFTYHTEVKAMAIYNLTSLSHSNLKTAAVSLSRQDGTIEIKDYPSTMNA